jgi:sigma-B regulation protein RsbU (phosphoserine phosphatase)
MARATAMIRASVSQVGSDLGEWVTKLNDQLAEDLRSGRFIGLTFMLADAAGATLQICAAGQYPPLHFDGARWEHFAVQNQLPLGIMPGFQYKAATVPLRPGEFWLLCSDGITEARNKAGDDFTLARLQESLPANETAASTVESAIAAWRKFVGGAPQHDDASLLLLDWRGAAPPASLEMLCCADNLKCGRDFIERWAAYAGFDDITVGQIVTACDEAATNIFRHGYRQKPGPISYQAELDDACLTFRIQDRAEPVDRAKIHGRDLADLKPGGLGTFIIDHVFDTVRYEPTAAGTGLTLQKKLP